MLTTDEAARVVVWLAMHPGWLMALVWAVVAGPAVAGNSFLVSRKIIRRKKVTGACFRHRRRSI